MLVGMQKDFPRWSEQKSKLNDVSVALSFKYSIKVSPAQSASKTSVGRGRPEGNRISFDPDIRINFLQAKSN